MKTHFCEVCPFLTFNQVSDGSADAMTRKKKDQGGMQFFGDLALCLIDEVHFLGESGRGSSLEAGVVSRIRTVGQLPEMQQV
jgi:ATP-dependent DNA helicase HFM1/MER3